MFSPKNRWLSDQRADQLVLLILILALTIKFTFFDDRSQQASQSLDSPISKYNSVLVETKTDTDSAMEKSKYGLIS